MTQTGTVINVVRSEAGTYQFLEYVSFLVGAFSRSEASHRTTAMFISYLLETASRITKRLLPACFPEMAAVIGGINCVIP